MMQDPLSSEERALQRALGAGSPPRPRRSDQAFARSVAQVHRRPWGAPWRAVLPLAAFAAAALIFVSSQRSIPHHPVVAPPAASPRSTSAELLALSMAALDGEFLRAGVFVGGPFDDHLSKGEMVMSDEGGMEEWLPAELSAQLFGQAPETAADVAPPNAVDGEPADGAAKAESERLAALDVIDPLDRADELASFDDSALASLAGLLDEQLAL